MSQALATASDPLALAQTLNPRLRALSTRIEYERRLPLEVVAELAAMGFFALCVPRSLQGEETQPTTLIRVIEELARGDAAAAWCVMIGATTGLVAGWLDKSAPTRSSPVRRRRWPAECSLRWAVRSRCLAAIA